MKNEYEWASKKRSHKILAILIPTIAFEIRLFASGRVSRVKKITLKINAKKTAIFEYDGIHCNRCVGKSFNSTTICRGQLKKNMDTRKIKFRQTERKFREFFTPPIDYRISQWVSGALLQMESMKVIVPVVVGNQKKPVYHVTSLCGFGCIFFLCANFSLWLSDCLSIVVILNQLYRFEIRVKNLSSTIHIYELVARTPKHTFSLHWMENRNTTVI